MVEVKDPIRAALIDELKIFRKGEGHPSSARMTGLFYLVEALGDGIPERAFDEFAAIYEEHGRDPETAIGAYFYLSGWGVGLDSVDKRRFRYRDEFLREISTPLRRSNRGIAELATIIRDRNEHSRPWAFVSIFQSKNAFQPFLDFNLGYESWQKPSVHINGNEVEIDFDLRETPDTKHRFTKRIIMPEAPLNLDVQFGEQMAVVRVDWPMPIWPIWSVMSWTADPRILTHLRTFRSRSIEVSLQWWRQTQPSAVDGLVGDGAIWAERADPNAMKLPEGWRIT